MKPSLDMIVSVVSEITLTESTALYSSAKRARLAMPRQIVWYMATKIYGYEYGEVASLFSDRSDRAIQKAVLDFSRRKRATDSFASAVVDKAKAIIEMRLQSSVEASTKALTDGVMGDLEKIKSLRIKGFTVPKIAERTGLDELYVAKVCGLPMWRGKETTGANR